MMTTEEAIRKLKYSKKAYQTLIDEKVDSGKLVGDGVRGEWKAETSLDEAYKSMIEAIDLAIKALEQKAVIGKIRAEIEQLTSRYSISKERGGMGIVEWSDRLIKESDVLQIIDKYNTESEG